MAASKNTSSNLINYLISTKTGDIQNAGTDANVRIVIFGSKSKTDSIHLKENKERKNKFERGRLDEFAIQANDVGKITKITIGHDNKGLASRWFLEKVTVKNDREAVVFDVNKWIDEKQSSIDLVAKVEPEKSAIQERRSSPDEKDNQARYIIKIKTGHIRNAGTDSTVFITLYGNKGKTDKITLIESKRPGKIFEKAKTDEFHVKGKNVGQIYKVNVGHDSDGSIKSWYLDSIIVIAPDANYRFLAKRWFDKNEGDGKTSVDLFDEFNKEMRKSEENESANDSREMSEYHVIVKTSDEKAAGTDGNVSITINSTNKSTGTIVLDKSKCTNGTSSDLFQQNVINEFKFQAVNLNNHIDHIHIGHDASKQATSWLVEYVKIKVNGHAYGFQIGKWLDKKDGNNFINVKVTSIKKRGSDFTSDPNKRLAQYTRSELTRIKTAMRTESSKIRFPKRREHQPFVFNDLYPYYDTKQVENLLDMPRDESPIGHFNRMTALGIVEPWVAYRMEHSVPVSAFPTKETTPRSNLNSAAPTKVSQKSLLNYSIRPNRNEIEGSTLTPRFPQVSLKKPKNMNGPFYVDDVDEIRKQLKKNLGAESHARQAEDKTRTINDFYRMKLDHFHPLSKDHMIQVYHAYLDNTAGSRRALRELLNEGKNLPGIDDPNDSRKSKSAINV